MVIEIKNTVDKYSIFINNEERFSLNKRLVHAGVGAIAIGKLAEVMYANDISFTGSVAIGVGAIVVYNASLNKKLILVACSLITVVTFLNDYRFEKDPLWAKFVVACATYIYAIGLSTMILGAWLVAWSGLSSEFAQGN